MIAEGMEENQRGDGWGRGGSVGVDDVWREVLGRVFWCTVSR